MRKARRGSRRPPPSVRADRGHLSAIAGAVHERATELAGDWIGKGGRPILPSAGVALETQHFPDSPNQKGFPSTRLDPGKVRTSRTEWVFS